MKAMLSTAPGGPETLELTEMPQPEPKKGQVRIRIRAAGLNFPDTLIIKDLYKIQNEKAQKFSSVTQVYLYTSENSIKDVKYI